MPADNTIPHAPSAHHGNGDAPYPCSMRATPPGAEWSISYGYCRTSMDALSGRHDPRCPASCAHKAPIRVAAQFDKQFGWHGAKAAAEWARKQKQGKDAA